MGGAAAGGDGREGRYRNQMGLDTRELDMKDYGPISHERSRIKGRDLGRWDCHQQQLHVYRYLAYMSSY